MPNSLKRASSLQTEKEKSTPNAYKLFIMAAKKEINKKKIIG